MLRCMLGSVKGEKSENPKGEREIGKWNKGGKKSTVVDESLSKTSTRCSVPEITS